MSSVTGHIVNHAQLKVLRSFINGLPPGKYSPSNPKILLTAIDDLINSQKESIGKVNERSTPWMICVNSREQVLQPLDKTLTKVLNALKATEAKPEIIADIKSQIDKMKGIRKTPKIKMDPTDPSTPSDESIHQISAAQTDINHIIDYFHKLILLLQAEPLYDPAEDGIKVADLILFVKAIEDANAAVVNAFPPLDNARIARNETLYGVDGGHEIQAKVKKYILSIFGTSSKQYRQFSGVRFTKPKL